MNRFINICFYLLTCLIFISCGSTMVQPPEFAINVIEDVMKFSDGTKRYYNNIDFVNGGMNFLAGGMDYIFLGNMSYAGRVYQKSFIRRSDKLSFGLEDDPLFLCQQDDRKSIFCGSHVRLIIPLSAMGIRQAADNRNFFSTTDDVLICATSAGHSGSAIYLLNGKSLGNLRRLNMEASSTLSDDDPFATPHEMYFKARTLCPEFPEQKFAFSQITSKRSNDDKSVIWIAGLWLRKVGLQLKTFSSLNIIPYGKALDGKQGALSAKLSSTLFQPQSSILSGIAEFVGFHSINLSNNAPRTMVITFLRQEYKSRILFMNPVDTTAVPSSLEMPFENTFTGLLAMSFNCRSLFRPNDCPRHGYCFTNSFNYPLLKDVAVFNGTIFAIFSTPSATWGARSALCTLSLNIVTNYFNKCDAKNSLQGSIAHVFDCDASLSMKSNGTQSEQADESPKEDAAVLDESDSVAIFETEGVFTRLQITKRSTSNVLNVVIASDAGKIMKGHLKLNDKSWMFSHAATIIISEDEKISNLATHSLSYRSFVMTDMAVYMWSFDAICSSYSRIRHCLQDFDCTWSFDKRSCTSKPKSELQIDSKTRGCASLSPENVTINASQGSTVRLVCNPPCLFDTAVRWEVPADVDKNKYLVMDDVLVMFDMFGGRSRPANSSDSDLLSVSCYTEQRNLGSAAKTLVQFSINKTCGAYCQRNRNMEAWCLKTWKQKIGLPTDTSHYLRV